jgi:hypothetical protein
VNALFEEMLAGMGGDMGAGADVKIAHLGDRKEEWVAAAEEEAAPVLAAPKQRLTHAERKERARVRPDRPPLRPPTRSPTHLAATAAYFLARWKCHTAMFYKPAKRGRHGRHCHVT